MAPNVPKTVGESLYWSYANLAMAFASARHDERTYQQVDFIVRNKTFYGLLRGTLQMGSFLIDEKWKIYTSEACCYCGSRAELTLDHLIPQFKGGKHSADNLVVACRSCNSSKKALDLLEWMRKRHEFPSLGLLRRYLKLAIQYCIENNLMDIALKAAENAVPRQLILFDDAEKCHSPLNPADAVGSMPFSISLLPHRFPDPPDLIGWVEPLEDE